MILQLVICLLVIAAASLLITQGRRRRIWSALIFTGLSAMAYLFMNNLGAPQTPSFIYQWLPYDSLKADINISSSARMQQVFMPLVWLLAGLVYLNTIFTSERHSLHFNILMLLNFISLILLASSHDFLQLMFAGCLFAIIGFYMPDLPQQRKKIFIFNFLEDMAIFMALSIVYGKTGSVSLASLSEYTAAGRHQDMVAFLLLFAIGGKCGLFLLNGQYFNLKDISFNRVICIMAFSTPLSGIILATKLRPLLEASNLADGILPYWLPLSIFGALLCALVNNNLKSKAIALSLALYAFMLFISYTHPEFLYTAIPGFLILNTFIVMAFVVASNAASAETDISRLGGFWKMTKGNFALCALMILALSAGFSNWMTPPVFAVFSIAYLGTLSLIFKNIYLGQPRADEKILAFAQNTGCLYWGPLIGTAAWLLWQHDTWKNPETYALFGWFVILFLLFPALWLTKIGCLPLFKADILSVFYDRLIIRPLWLCGRILWLVLDVVVIERNIIGGLSATTTTLIGIMHKLHEPRARNFILSILSGLLLMLIYWGFYIYE